MHGPPQMVYTAADEQRRREEGGVEEVADKAQVGAGASTLRRCPVACSCCYIAASRLHSLLHHSPRHTPITVTRNLQSGKANKTARG